MMNEQKVPQLRFSGFDDEWEEKKLGDSIIEVNERTSDFNKNPLFSLTIENGITAKTERYERSQLVTKEDDLFKVMHPQNFATNPMNLRFGAVGFCKENSDVSVSGYYDVFSIDDNKCSSFWYPYFKTFNSLKKFDDAATGSLIEKRRVHFSTLKQLEFLQPSLKEKKKIGSFLSLIDSLIRAKTQKLESLKSVKKSLLQKCFPKDGEKVPQMRFEGFSGNWEEIQFSDCFDLLTNNTLSRDELNFSGGTVKSVHYGDVLIKFPEITDVCIEKIAYITDEDVAKKYSKCLLRNGDIIIADTAEDETVGKCSEIQNCNEKVVSGLHTIPVRPKIEFAKKYLGFFMNSESFHNQLLPLIQGTKVSSISKSAIEDVIVRYPVDLKEQEKIGQVFSKYNELIKLQEMEVENLKTIKKSLLQKMFI